MIMCGGMYRAYLYFNKVLQTKRMINLSKGILERSFNSFFFKSGGSSKNLFMTKTGCKKIQYVNHANSHSLDTWPATTLIVAYSNAQSPIFHIANLLNLFIINLL